MILARGLGLRIVAIATGILGALFSLQVCGPGIPGFRHDWSWPVDYAGWVSFLAHSTSGWDDRGFGQPHPYPTQFLVALLLSPIGLLSSKAALVVVLLGITALFAYGSWRLTDEGRAPLWIVLALTSIAIFNPWTYSKIVAGHVMMVLSLAALFAFYAEWRVGRVKPRLWLFATLCAVQLQFAVVLLCFVVLTFRRAESRWGFAAAAVSLAPSLIGIVAAGQSLSQIPYLTAWQHGQSVPLTDGIRLAGYFAGYDRALPVWFMDATWLYPACALVAFATLRDRWAWAIILAASAGVIAASGDLFFPTIYDWIVTHVVISGIFRELYDLIGLVAIAYLALIAMGSRNVFVRGVSVSLAIAGPLAWALASPWQWWVPLELSRSVDFTAQMGANERYALFPYRQPMMFRGRGSGSDPEILSKLGRNISPLNNYADEYPAIAALASYELHGTTEMLSKLGVAKIVTRTDVQSDIAQLAGQTLVPTHSARFRALSTAIPYLPMVSYVPAPKVTFRIPYPGDNEIFFSDASVAPFYRVPEMRNSLDPRQGWIDLRFTYERYPELAQPFGGAYTEQSLVGLPLRGPAALVMVRGALIDDRHRIIYRGKSRYDWVRLDARTKEVYCRGACAVVGTSDLPSTRQPPYQREYRAADAVFPLPWLGVVSSRDSQLPALRLNSSYNPGWVALYGLHLLPHERVDGVANLWETPKDAPGRIFLVHIPSALQCIAEFVALGALIWILSSMGLARHPGSRV